MSTDKLISQEAVVKALASRADLTGAEIAKVTGLARSTVDKTLAALEHARRVRRDPGGRDGAAGCPTARRSHPQTSTTRRLAHRPHVCVPANSMSSSGATSTR